MSYLPYKVTALARSDNGDLNIIPGATVTVLTSSGVHATLRESDLTTPISNPFDCDSNGERQIFLQGGTYTFSVEGGQSWEVRLSGATDIQSVATIADMEALTGVTAGQIFDVLEYSTGLGYGGGRIKAMSGSVTPDNVITFASATAGIYFERLDVSTVDCDLAGIAGDAVTDDTTKLVAAMAAATGKKFYLNRHCRMTEVGLTVPSNTTVEFGPNGKISLLPHNAESYQILRVHDVSDVELRNVFVDGRRDLNSATGGEFGMGISIRGTGGQIRVINPKSVNCWGDSYYIGSTTQPYCNDVYIENIYGDGSRRQGLSVISVKKLVVQGGSLGNITGTLPSAGIDIEPNNSGEYLEYIRINNVRTYNNTFSGAPGFLLFLQTLGDAGGRKIDIEFNNCTDESSTVGYVIRATPINLQGRVVFNNCKAIKNLFGAFTAYDTASTGPRIEVNDLWVEDSNRNASTSSNISAPMNVQREVGSANSYTIGGVHFFNPRVLFTSGTTASLYHAKDLNGGTALANCSLIDPVIVSGSANRLLFVGPGSDIKVSDKFDQIYRDLTIGVTPAVDNSFSVSIRHNRTTGNSGFTIGTNSFLGKTPMIIENTDNGQFTLTPPTGGNFIGQAVDISARCALGPGHRIIVEKVNSLVYRIVSLQGTFTFV